MANYVLFPLLTVVPFFLYKIVFMHMYEYIFSNLNVCCNLFYLTLFFLRAENQAPSTRAKTIFSPPFSFDAFQE